MSYQAYETFDISVRAKMLLNHLSVPIIIHWSLQTVRVDCREYMCVRKFIKAASEGIKSKKIRCCLDNDDIYLNRVKEGFNTYFGVKMTIFKKLKNIFLNFLTKYDMLSIQRRIWKLEPSVRFDKIPQKLFLK